MSGSFSKVSALADLRQSLFGREEEGITGGCTVRQKIKPRFSFPRFYGDSPCGRGLSKADVAPNSKDDLVLSKSGMLELIAEVPESGASRGRSGTPRKRSHHHKVGLPLRSRLGMKPDASVFYDLEVFDHASDEVRIGSGIEPGYVEELGRVVRSGPRTRFVGGSGTGFELGLEGSRLKSGIGSWTATVGSISGPIGGVGSGMESVETKMETDGEGETMKDLIGRTETHSKYSTANGSDSDVSIASSSVFDGSKNMECSALVEPPPSSDNPSMVIRSQSLSLRTSGNLLRQHGERIVRSIKKRLSFAGFVRTSESALKLDVTDSLVPPPPRSHSCGELVNTGPDCLQDVLLGLERDPWANSAALTSMGGGNERVFFASQHSEVRMQSQSQKLL